MAATLGFAVLVWSYDWLYEARHSAQVAERLARRGEHALQQDTQQQGSQCT